MSDSSTARKEDRCVKRRISAGRITEAVKELCIRAAYELPDDVCRALSNAADREQSPLGKSVLKQLMQNADIARQGQYPICQDTGLTVVFVALGEDACIGDGSLAEAVTEGIRQGYEGGYLRKSMVADPLYDRKNTDDNTPPTIHCIRVPGDRCTITVVPKGGGSENMSRLKMCKPGDGESGVTDFVVETVQNAGANPCPPLIVGVGIGGNFETAPLLAKEALLREIGSEHPDLRYRRLEENLLEGINNTGIGPAGLGGRITALAVHVVSAPCHIASSPVAVNLNCHAARHTQAVL